MDHALCSDSVHPGLVVAAPAALDTARRRAPQPTAPSPAAGAGPGLGAPPGVCRPGTGLSRLAALALAAGTLLAAGQPSPALAAPKAAAAPKTTGCLIEPDRISDVGSQVVGVVQQVDAERGDRVRGGQALVTLRAGVELANQGVADARVRVDADVQAARSSLDLAQQKVQRAESLVAQSFISNQALDQARTEHDMARHRLAQALGQQRIWTEERRVAQAQVGMRTVRSPFDGVVTERFTNPGERVEDRPLMRVAVINPLRVELMVPTAQYGTLALGSAVTVQPELPGTPAVVAHVTQIDRVMDAASNTFRVRLRLPNPDHRLPAGLRCKAELPAQTATAPVPAAAPARSGAQPTATTRGAVPRAGRPGPT